jgi:hypothetical protein
MVGALVLSRLVNDPELSDEVLEQTRRWIGANRGSDPKSSDFSSYATAASRGPAVTRFSFALGSVQPRRRFFAWLGSNFLWKSQR